MEIIQDSPVIESQVTDTQVDTQSTEQPQEPSNFEFEIQYNKEPIKINDPEELKNLAQLGMHWKNKKENEFNSVKSEYERIQQDYNARKPQLEYLDNFLKTNGYDSWDDYQKDLQVQEYINQGISKEYAEEMAENKRFRESVLAERAQSEQQQKYHREFSEFTEMFPEIAQKLINAKEGEIVIDPKVFELQEQHGLSLTDAYLRHQYMNRDVQNQQMEQEIINKIANNGSTSTGSVNGAPPKPLDIGSMSDKEFAEFQQRVERGELKRS